MQKQAIFLMGPTAAGKTDLAIELSQHLPVDIISVDSAMVYRGMDIGTGKPTAAQLALAPHQLIDICDPADAYSAARFCVDAEAAMQNSWQKQRIPLLVGGTMLYFRALQFGLAQLPSADPKLRAELAAQAQDLGWPAMHAKLALLDAVAAQRLKPNDAQRIARALEINILTGKSLNEQYAAQTIKHLDYQLHSFALLPATRAELHAKITARFMQMLDQGLLDEVRTLYARSDLNPQLPSIRSVGYRQVWAYLANELDYAEMVEQAIAATRQLAKRQHTWLRTWPGIINIQSYDHTALDTVLKTVLDF